MSVVRKFFLVNATAAVTAYIPALICASIAICTVGASPCWSQAADVSSYPRLGLSTDRNMRVMSVDEDSPASKSRLQVGDTIVSVDGKFTAKMDMRSHYQCLLGQPGQVYQLVIERSGKQYTVPLERYGAPSAVPSSQTRAIAANTLPEVKTAPLPPPQLSAQESQLIKVFRHTDRTDDVVRRLQKGLALLPDAVQRNFIGNGVIVMVTPTRKELTGNSGRACYQVHNKRVIIPEWDDVANEPVAMNRLPITILHELGHAYDHTNGRLSFTDTFQSLYSSEAALVPADKRKQLAYFLESENNGDMVPHKPPEECFASLFARRFYVGPDRLLDTLKSCFPKCSQFVERL